MKRKTYSLSGYLVFQIAVMLLVALLYFEFIPLVLPQCISNLPSCASAHNCQCDGKKCRCEYIDEFGHTKPIECVFDKLKENIQNVKIEMNTVKYSELELQECINLVFKDFENIPGILNKISYDESDATGEIEEWKKIYHGNEIILLKTDFKAYNDDKVIEQGFNKNEEYVWKWICMKEDNTWKIVNHGF